MKKTIRVVAAVIEKDGCVFAAQRAYGFLKGRWEFPGGKIESGETPEKAIVREIKEELDTEIEVERFLTNVKYEYPDFNLDMDVFKCQVSSGRLQIEKGIHLEEAFFPLETLEKHEWCPADMLVVETIKKLQKNH